MQGDVRLDAISVSVNIQKEHWQSQWHPEKDLKH
jgi:hypothetical protein